MTFGEYALAALVAFGDFLVFLGAWVMMLFAWRRFRTRRKRSLSSYLLLFAFPVGMTIIWLTVGLMYILFFGIPEG